MQNYINQLLTDLQEAKKNIMPNPLTGNEPYEEFEAKMFAIETDRGKPAKEVLGIAHEELPPPEMLTEEQQIQLIDAVLDLFEARGQGIDLKENMPIAVQYELLRDVFAENIHASPGWHIDFCDGWCPDCKILTYCDSWKDSWTPEEIEEQRTKTKR